MDVLTPQEPTSKPEFQMSNEPLRPAHDSNYIRLQGYLGVDNLDSTQKDKLNYIYNSITDGDETEAALLWKLSMIENKIGTPPLGVNRVDHLIGFLKLSAQLDTLQAQLMDIYGK